MAAEVVPLRVSRRTCAVVPVKAFSRAKQRLSGVLTDVQRAELARVMLQDVIATLRATRRISMVLLVTSDVEVIGLAAETGVQAIKDNGEAGLNHAVALGCAVASEQGADILIIPTDVPFVTVGEIDAVLDELYQHDIVLVPALLDGGTNAVGLRQNTCFTPSFGDNSFARHQAGARGRGIRHCELRLEALGLDIDRPSNLTVPLDVSAESRTAEFLRNLSLNCRAPTDIKTGAHAL